MKPPMGRLQGVAVHLAEQEGCAETGTGFTNQRAKWHRLGDVFPVIKMRTSGAKG